MTDNHVFEEEVKSAVFDRVNYNGGAMDEELLQIIDEYVLDRKYSYIELSRKLKLRNTIFNAIKRFDILQDLIDDDEITEIMINGYKDIYIEKNGKTVRYDKAFESKEKLLDIIQRIAAKSNKIVNESVPIVDTRLENGSRVNIVMTPIAMDGPAVTIRKFYNNPITMESLIEYGSISVEAALFLKELVENKYNIFICGGTGSGKTTFLNALSNYIPKDERIITIEDSAELKLQGIPNLVRMEARSANTEGKNSVQIRDMIKTSLRMRPDRIIVGEVRGAEALDMLSAMGTGHDGSMSTGHANGPRQMLLRLETMALMAADIPVEAIRNQIAACVDIIVHLSRMRDGSRKILNISQIEGIKKGESGNEIGLIPLFEYKMGSGLNRTDKMLIPK